MESDSESILPLRAGIAMKAETAAAEAAPFDTSGAALLDDPVEQLRFTRHTRERDGGILCESALQLSGMYCVGCAGIIEQALLRVPGVRGAHVSAAAQRAAVQWDPQRTRPSLLIAAVREAGYDAAPDIAASARALRQAEDRQMLWRLFVAAFCMMQVMMLATPSYIATDATLPADLAQLLNWGSWVLSLPVLLFSAGPFLRGMWRSLLQARISMDVPVAIGVLVTFIASTGATFDPGGAFGAEVYFDSMTMFVTFLLAGRYFELRARHRAAAALEGAVDDLPAQAQRLRADGSLEAVSVQRLLVGDRVQVALGQRFPADGTIEQGQTRVDEAMLSGEATALPRGVGELVLAGSINLGAPVLMRVDQVGADTRYAAIVDLMREAMSQRPALARLADRWAAPFLWTVLLLAASAAAVWSVIDPSRAVWVAVSVLIVTCPCALSLAVPAVLVSAAGGLARRGVLLGRLDALEAMTRLDRLFIDKTGTLTQRIRQLRQVRLLRGNEAMTDATSALSVAASLAAWSTHPASSALVRAQGAAAPGAWHEVHEQAGQGLSARDATGRAWRLGAAQWAAALGEAAPLIVPVQAQVVLACDDGGCVAFELDDGLRSGARSSMAALQAQGLAITLLSGDSAARARQLADELGLGEALGALGPQDKLAALAAAQQRGECVAMAGDGVNDAPVLARADVSFAMGHGAAVARAQADVTLLRDDLLGIVDTLRVARRSMRLVRQNLGWALGYNAVCVPLALAGWLPPWAAGLGMATSSAVVVLNALRAAR